MSSPSYAHKAVNRALGQAIHRFELIEHGDSIALGVSGGADSLALWRMLEERRRRAPIDYRVTGIHIDLGFGAATGAHLEEYAARMGYQFYWEQQDFGPRAHSSDNTENPCFLCARLRRKRLFQLTDELECTKLALGHHKDDLIETFLLNICYIGEVSTMLPRQSFFDGALTLIRPFALAEKRHIKRYARDCSLPVIKSGCPSEQQKDSRRMYIRELLKDMYRSNRKVKGNIFRAMHGNRVNLEYLL